MAKRAPMTDKDGEVRKITAADLRRLKPAAAMLPPKLVDVMGIKPLGPQNSPTRQATTISLSS